MRDIKSAVQIALGIAVATLSVPGTSYAQESARSGEVLEEITITGSRIKRAGFETLQPALVVSSQTIEDRAQTNIADVLKDLPAFGIPESTRAGGQDGLAIGQSFANFFGLGSQRTLTLVDGKRFVAANSPAVQGVAPPGLQVDLNTIPAALVERIETIAVGGAPIYGADAIAGTVNIIRKRNFEGFSGTVQSSSSEHGDAEYNRIQGVYGLNINERGNLTVALEYNKQDPLIQTDREQTAQTLFFLEPADPNSPFQQVLTRDGRAVIVNYNGLPLTSPGFLHVPRTPGGPLFEGAIHDAQGRPVQFAPDGTLVPYNPGNTTGSFVFFQGGDGLDLAAATSLLTETERKLANVFFNYDLTDNVKLNVEGWYARTDGAEVVNQPDYNEAAFATGDETPTNVRNGQIPLRLDNPFLAGQARALIGQNIDFDGDGAPDPTIDFDGDGVAETPGFWLSKGHQDMFGGHRQSSSQDLLRAVVGLEGKLEFAGRAFDWDVTYIHGRTTSTYRDLGILQREFNLALDAVRDPTSGQIRCRSDEAGCAPLNVFGFGAPSAAATAYVTEPFSTDTTITQNLGSANVTGELFGVPAGSVRFAAGLEYRRESANFDPDFLSRSTLLTATPLTGLTGSFNTKEAYTELAVPLVSPQQDVPLVDSLEFEGAVRYVDHSVAGSDTTWTAGLRWAPIPDVRLRGNYTESIRAPAVTELFLPTASIFTFANDPCHRLFIDQGANAATRRANCDQEVQQPFNSIIVNASQRATVSGNQDLRNEQAEAWTIGAILRPRFLPQLTLAVDWVEIELTDAIQQLDATTILESCYDSASYPTAEPCGRFDRDANGQVINLRTGYLNAGLLNFSGLTADLNYDLDFERLGQLTIGLNYFYLDTLESSVTGTDFDPDAGEIGNSRNRATLNFAYRNGPFGGLLQTQYVGEAVFDREDSPRTRDVRGVDEFWLFNAGLSYRFTKGLSAQLNIDNLLDEEAPRGSLAGASGAAPSPSPGVYFSGVLGRYFTLSLRAQF